MVEKDQKRQQWVLFQRRLIAIGMGSMCALTGVFALSPVATQAKLLHKYLPPQITAPNEVAAMTVDSGHLWVAESNSGTKELNAATGTFEQQLEQSGGDPRGVAVGHGTGETQVYVAEGREVGVFSESGVLLGRWTGADATSGPFSERVDGVAVDNNSDKLADPAAGDVYVSDFLQHVVDVFRPAADGKEEFVTQITEAEVGEPFNPEYIAVDEASGSVLITDGNQEYHSVDIFEPTALGGYAFVRKITGPPDGTFTHFGALAVAVGAGEGSSGEGDVYVTAFGATVAHEIYEFTLTGAFVDRITGVETQAGSFGEVADLRAVAVDPSSHHVFVDDYHRRIDQEGPSAIDVFGPNVVVPDVTTGAVSEPKVEAGALSVTLNGTVNPLNEGDASCQFVWGSGSTFGQTSACSGSAPQVADGSNPAAVEATLHGLEPDTLYFYRLQATNNNGTNRGEEEAPQEVRTPGPGLHGEWASGVASTSATLDARIDPNGTPTSYYFQYGAEECKVAFQRCVVVPALPGASLGSGDTDALAPLHVQGLSADTTYHYRVVVVSTLELSAGKPEAQVFYGSDQTFTTQPERSGLTLPDGRAWEQVSQADKHGALIYGLNQGSAVIQASADGSAMTYLTSSPTETEGLAGYSIQAQVFSRHGGDGGWSTQDLGALRATPEGATAEQEHEYPFFSTDLSVGVLEQHLLDSTLLSEEASERTPYLRRQSLCEAPATEHACYLPLVTGKEPVADVPVGTHFGGSDPHHVQVQFVGASPDLRHVIVKSKVALTTLPMSGEEEIYEWSADSPAAERLQLVSVLPSETPVQGGGVRTIGSDPNAGTTSDGRHAISDDGSRVFWPSAGSLYMRDTVKGETIELRGNGGSENPTFQFATGDGSTVFFTENRELYKCTITEVNHKLTCDLADLTPGGDVMKDILGASEDGSFVYFVSADNLYVYHASELHLIAALSPEDESDWGNEGGALDHQLGELTAAVSSNGRYAAFMSNRSLTGYDNRDVSSGAPDEEVYLYDAVTKRLVCASCAPTGARPVGVERRGSLRLAFSSSGDEQGVWFAANIPGWTKNGDSQIALYQSRYLADNGRLFFNSSDALVPQDINGTEDVYQYEPAGVGECETALSTFSERLSGCVGLISSGTSSAESVFMDASATGARDGEGHEGGGDVFFLSAEKLVSQDLDTAYDVYDAHECTTLAPCVTPPVVVPECITVDACRSAPLEQPTVFGPGPSATFSGVGNVAGVGSKPAVEQRKLTRARKLAAALRSCRKTRARNRRVACERRARRRYGVVKSGSANAKRGRR